KAAAKRKIVEARQEHEALSQRMLEVEADIAKFDRQTETWHKARQLVSAELQQIEKLEQTLQRHREQEQRFAALFERNYDTDLKLALQLAVKKTREEIVELQRRLERPPATSERAPFPAREDAAPLN